MRVVLENDRGLIKEVKAGFSWTTLFFVFFPALFRGDLKWAAIMIVVSLVAGLLTSWMGSIGVVVSQIIFAFVYNKIYIKELLEYGYVPANEQAWKVLYEKKVLTQNIA